MDSLDYTRNILQVKGNVSMNRLHSVMWSSLGNKMWSGTENLDYESCLTLTRGSGCGHNWRLSLSSPPPSGNVHTDPIYEKYKPSHFCVCAFLCPGHCLQVVWSCFLKFLHGKAVQPLRKSGTVLSKSTGSFRAFSGSLWKHWDSMHMRGKTS